jgi:hypothetical protein
MNKLHNQKKLKMILVKPKKKYFMQLEMEENLDYIEHGMIV